MKTLLLTFILLFTQNLYASWKPILNEDGIEVYSGEISNSGIIPFLARGNVNASLEDVTELLKDYQEKYKWSPKLKSVKMHQQFENERYIFSEYYKTPWPAADREFLLEGSVTYHSKDHVQFYAQSIENEFKDENHIQADVKFLKVDLKKIAENQTSVEFAFHGDMRGWMPTWLINLIQKKWPLRFIQGMRRHLNVQTH